MNHHACQWRDHQLSATCVLNTFSLLVPLWLKIFANYNCANQNNQNSSSQAEIFERCQDVPFETEYHFGMRLSEFNGQFINKKSRTFKHIWGITWQIEEAEFRPLLVSLCLNFTERCIKLSFDSNNTSEMFPTAVTFNNISCDIGFLLLWAKPRESEGQFSPARKTVLSGHQCNYALYLAI